MVKANIEMPVSCAKCRLFEEDHYYPSCRLTGYSELANFDYDNLRMPSCPFTPEETCTMTGYRCDWICSKCGTCLSEDLTYLYDSGDMEHGGPDYCPACGRRIVGWKT